MRDAIGYNLYRKPLCVTNRFLGGGSVTHDSRQFECFSYPTSVIFSIKIDGQVHFLIVPATLAMNDL